MALSARTNSGRCPRLIGSLAVTVPSTYWLLQQGPGKSHGHSSHGEHHGKEEHESAETKGKSEDTTESESDDSSDESKQDTPDTSDDETEAVNASGGGDVDESTEGGEAKDEGTLSVEEGADQQRERQPAKEMYPNASRESQQYEDYQYHQVLSARAAQSNLPAPGGYPPNSILQNPELQISQIQPPEPRTAYPPQLSPRNPFQPQPQPFRFSSAGGYNMASPRAVRPADLPRLDTQPVPQAIPGLPNHIQRYSIQHTPVEMQAATFPPAARKPSEPTIPQSPTSPAPRSQTGSEAPRVASPYGVQSPPPPFLAEHNPVVEDSRSPVAPHSPGPLPIKTHRDSLPHTGINTDPTYPATQPGTQLSPVRESVRHQFSPPPTKFTPIYDPYSTVGPNGLSSVNHRPGQVAHPNMTHDDEEWGHSLCECGDVSTGCLGCFCPCIVYGKTQYRISQKSAKKDPTDLLGYKACNGPCGLMCLLCGFQWTLAFFQRTRIRSIYKVKGSCANDCLAACCCLPCALIQDEREVRDREDERRRQAGPVSAIDSYVVPGGMEYAPQQGR
ncbi:MAG: hypothetical protein M1839_004071 [Geoglossum umbratile]|nr:MAG: hypothetical protein M1839_004071 [Geoglossum umbratile]